MQNQDGGWAAFDVDNDKLFLNQIPFSDMYALCDPSSADVTGRILEAFGLLIKHLRDVHLAEELMAQLKLASTRAVTYLTQSQESNGAWYGRWGSNYIYGTSNVLCGLASFLDNNDCYLQGLTTPATTWLKSVQNADGGWGEVLHTYRDRTQAGCGSSTASQTAWALMALIAFLPPTDEAIERGIAYLTKSQTDKKGSGSSWPEKQYTGTGFPGFFYIGYQLYPHYFPMMALGRYLHSRAVGGKECLVVEKVVPSRRATKGEPEQDGGVRSRLNRRL